MDTARGRNHPASPTASLRWSRQTPSVQAGLRAREAMVVYDDPRGLRLPMSCDTVAIAVLQLAYRCGGSSGFGALPRLTRFPFNPDRVDDRGT